MAYFRELQPLLTTPFAKLDALVNLVARRGKQTSPHVCASGNATTVRFLHEGCSAKPLLNE
jgi:hypothetical protein